MALARLLGTTGRRILTSPGDGHCLIHSVSNSWSSQHPSLLPLDLETIKSSIFTEAVNNAHLYVPFLPTKHSLFEGLRHYLIDKQYNHAFGDLVPLVIANAVSVNLNVFNDKCKNGYDMINLVPRSNSCISLDLHRSGDHYNAIEFVSSAYIIRNLSLKL